MKTNRTKTEDEGAEEVNEGVEVGGKKTTAGKVTSVTFKVRNPNILIGSGKNAKVLGYATRVFSLEEHGEDFQDLAKEFEETNTHRKIVKPTSKDDAEGIAKFNEDTQYNRNIPHPVIEKISE